MGIYCTVCSEPWEADTIHEEVTNRFPNKPWYVEDKPEPFKQPDTILAQCSVVIGTLPNSGGLPAVCWEKENHEIHTSDMWGHHEFVPQIQKEYKTWNPVPHIDKNTGLWYDEYIYDQYYQPILKEFQRTGCTTFGMPHNDTKGNPIFAAIYDMMGDDIDGILTLLDDAERMGYLE